jgi:hydroxymethylpyrimidine/phosphomethylpyrimidine kinase
VTAPVALTIAGSDPSGGAGIQADLKTFSAFGVWGASVLTALTAQNTREVQAVAEVEPGFVARQLDAVLADLDVRAAKTGMLHRAAVVVAVADVLDARRVPHLVIDPVVRSTSGTPLLEPSGVDVLRDRLLPLATLVTPNLDEAEALTGRAVRSPHAMADAARALVDLGARAALVTGGHLGGDPVDVLYDGRDVRELRAARIAGEARHGTGCALSAAITAGLARGVALDDAIATAKDWVTRAIARASRLGHGALALAFDEPAVPTRR